MKRIFMLTTHPVAPPWDSADKQLARSITRGLPGYRFLLFGRLGVRQSGLNATYIPIFSRRGKPGLPETLQIVSASGVLEQRADLVHAVVTVGPSFRSFCAIREHVPRRMRRPMVLTVPGIRDIRHLPKRRPADVVVALSDATADLLRTAGLGPVDVIPPGIPLERWPVRPDATDGRSVILFAGHYDASGGAKEAIRAVAAIPDRDVRPRLLLAMRARDNSAEAAASELRSLAAVADVDMEIRNEVSDMPSVIAGSTIVIFPSEQLHGKADIPLTLLEALATGRPVVAARSPSLAALEGAVTFVPPRDPDAFAREINPLLREPRYREERAAAGRQLVEQRFSEAGMARAYAEFYEELVK